ARPPVTPAPRSLPPGTITGWELSPAIDATMLVAGRLPDLTRMAWDKVAVEPEGFVLINRYRRSPSIVAPSDPGTHQLLVDSILHGRVAGSKVVFARTVLQSETSRLRLMHVGYS